MKRGNNNTDKKFSYTNVLKEYSGIVSWTKNLDLKSLMIKGFSLRRHGLRKAYGINIRNSDRKMQH